MLFVLIAKLNLKKLIAEIQISFTIYATVLCFRYFLNEVFILPIYLPTYLPDPTQNSL
jgi:hypothetical protein